MNLNKLKQFFLKNKKEILFFSSFMIIIFSTLDTTFANEPKEDTFIAALNGILTIASSFIAMLTALVSLLLNPGWINGTIFGFDIYLKEIWVLISNIVYFIFAFILITISFMNIVGNGAGTWELKTALPKFVVGVVMVPFTWFFVQFVLSISAFLTVAVLSLPHDVMTGNKNFDEYKKIKMCNTFVIDTVTKDKEEIEAGGKIQDSGCTKNAVDFGGTSVSLDSILSGDNSKGTSESVFGIINLYSYGIMKVNTITELDSNIVKTVKDLSNLSIKVVIDVLFLIIYLILIIALFMALFARGVWLWIYAMFSPIFGLLFFFGKAKEGVGDKKFGVGEFIKLALVPVYVSAALAFGLLFMFVASQGLSKNNSDGGSKIFTEVVEKDVEKKSSAIDIGGFKLVMKGVVGGTGGSIMSSMGNGLGQMIIQLFGLAILWIAIMAALKSSDITGKIIEPIEQFGKSVGSLIEKAPQYAPIIPTPGGAVSAQNMSRIGQRATSFMQEKDNTRAQDFMGRNGMFGAQPEQLSTMNLANKIEIEGIKGHTDTQKELLKSLQTKTSRDIEGNKENRNLLLQTLNKMGLKNSDGKEYTIKDIDSVNEIKEARFKIHIEFKGDSGYGSTNGIFKNTGNKDELENKIINNKNEISSPTASASVTESTNAENNTSPGKQNDTSEQSRSVSSQTATKNVSKEGKNTEKGDSTTESNNDSEK